MCAGKLDHCGKSYAPRTTLVPPLRAEQAIFALHPLVGTE